MTATTAAGSSAKSSSRRVGTCRTIPPAKVLVLGAGVAGLLISSNVTAADANNAGLWIELDAILAVVERAAPAVGRGQTNSRSWRRGSFAQRSTSS